MHPTAYKVIRFSLIYILNRALLRDISAIYIGSRVLNARPLPPIIAFNKC